MLTKSSLRRKLEHVLRELNKHSENEIKFTYHQLRHTYACFLHKAKIDIKEAQLLMGHKDVKVLLNIYTHLDEEDKKIAAEKLNNFTTTLTTTHT